MAKPEQQVIDYFKRKLRKFAAEHDYKLHIDKPPSTAFNSNGRPDLFIDLGPYHFRCEMKALGGKMSKLQEFYFDQRAEQMPHTCHLIVGKPGVDVFIDQLPQTMRSYRLWARTVL